MENLNSNGNGNGNGDLLLSCVQEQGDLMYVPKKWHHGTSNEYNGTTVGLAWQDTVGIFGLETKRQKKVRRLLKSGKSARNVWSLISNSRILLDELGRMAAKSDTNVLSTRKGKRLLKKAEHFAKRAKRIRVSFLDFRPNVLLAEIYAKSGRGQDGAREMLEVSIELSRVNRTAIPLNLLSGWLYYIGHTLRNVDVLDRAVPLFEELFAMSPPDTLMRTMSGLELGIIQWSMERDEEAEEALRRIEPELQRAFRTALSVGGVGDDDDAPPNIADFLDSRLAESGRALVRNLVPEFLPKAEL